jgi:hypothetical protein
MADDGGSRKEAAMRRLVASLILALLIGLVPGVASAGGPPSVGFYVDGTVYRTIGTPTDLSGTGAPESSFDVIYDFGGNQLNVATSAPGYRDYNGGRWLVHALSFNSSYEDTLAAHDLDGDGVIDTTAEVESALSDSSSTGATDSGVVKSFECPAIKA